MKTGAVAALVSIAAGLYLVTTTGGSGPYDSSIFTVIMHGMGAYFIARGLWMISELIHEYKED